MEGRNARCIRANMGSGTAQNRCIIGVTGTRNRTSAQTPTFASDDEQSAVSRVTVTRPQFGEEYFLTWTHGTYPYFFQPDYKAMDGRLVFALAATSSSGSLAGRRREMKIEGADKLQALQRGGAYWWGREPEPNGTFVQLQIVEPSSPTAAQ